MVRNEDRAAQCDAKIIPPVKRYLPRLIEKVPGIEEFITNKFVRAPAKIDGARLGRYLYDSRSRFAVHRAIVRSQDTDLSDGIHARVHDKRVLPARRVDSVVKHVRAIDLKDVVFHAATVHAVFSATSDTCFALV